MRVVVDNSTGGDEPLAQGVVTDLRDLGFTVDVIEPSSSSQFDTAVHLLTTGIVLRVDERPARSDLSSIEEVVRSRLQQHASPRRRTRAVPVALGMGGRVLTWIDVFG
jgi:hypothetical protein